MRPSRYRGAWRKRPQAPRPVEIQERDERACREVYRHRYLTTTLLRALIGEPLGLEPFAEGQYKVWFSFCEVGVFDEKKLLISPAHKPTSGVQK